MKDVTVAIFIVMILSSVVIFKIPNKSIAKELLSIGAKFHQETKLSLLQAIGTALGFKPQPPLYKRYETAKKIKLPEPTFRGLYLEDAIKKRRSIRKYSDEPLTISALSQLLFAAQGITSYGKYRTAPSAGALYPIEIYPVINNVEGIERGIYHYSVKDHSIELLKEGDYRERIIKACFNQEMAGKANVVFIFTAIFNRTTWKYGERGYRFVYIEAGHIAQNIYLQVTSMGLGSVVMGLFYDDELNQMLDIDGKNEATVYVQCIGTL